MMSTHNKAPTTVREVEQSSMRSAQFKSRRKVWPGLLAAGLLGAVVAGALISNLYDNRSPGARLDSVVASAKSGVQGQVSSLQGAASSAAQGTAQAADKVAVALGDVGITAAVKTSLAADPSLSALKIEVKTAKGVVSLDGPAPSEKARVRAQVLALAPSGVKHVDNHLVVTQRVSTPTPSSPPAAAFTPAPLAAPAPAVQAEPPVSAPGAPMTTVAPPAPDRPSEPVSDKPGDSKGPQAQ